MKFTEKSEDSRNYVKIKDGESVVGVFRGEIFEFRIHWGDQRSVVCKGVGCDLCKADKESSFRFRVNFIVKEDGAYVAKVMEQGWTFYAQLSALNKEYNPIESYAMKITRRGEKLQTKYTIFPVAKGEVDAEKEKLLSAVKLNDLGHTQEAKEESMPTPEHSSSTDDIPF